MNENFLSGLIIGSAIDIHRAVGPGLFESVYEELLYRELIREGLKVERQLPIPVTFKEEVINMGFKADLLVEERVIVEIKSIETIAKIHHKQILNYLKLANLKLGLLINFNEVLLKNGIHRKVNGF